MGRLQFSVDSGGVAQCVYVLCSARGCLWIRFFSMWGEVNVSLCMFKAQGQAKAIVVFRKGAWE